MSGEERKERRLKKRQLKREKRKVMKHATGLSVFLGILSALCILLTVITGVFDQTFYVITKTNYARVNDTSEDAVYFGSDFSDDEERRDYGKELVSRLEEEGAVLLKNENQCLPLAQGSKVSCFSQSALRLVYGGTGSGSVDTSTATDLKDGLEHQGFVVNETLWDFYESGEGADYARGTRSIRGGGSWEINEVPWDIYTEDVKNSVSSYGDAAIVVLGRCGGEGTDLPIDSCSDGKNGNYLALNDTETEMLTHLADMKKEGTISKIIVLLNTSNALEVGFLSDENYAIDAALWIGGVGENGISGVAKILSGETNPSGRLVDTYCKNNLTSPAMQNFGAFVYTNAGEAGVDGEEGMSDYYLVYQEGIYVGYRYYETRYEDMVMGTGNTQDYRYSSDVAYPFGYGLSYTTFSEELASAEFDAEEDQFIFDVRVTNTGDTAGKHTVQIYQQSPYTDYDKANYIEQASVNLCGFGKTEILEPGESETLKITVERRELAAYDAHGAKTYILEEGDYYFILGENAHDAVNNVLAKKGFSVESTDGRMDADGNADMVYCYHQDKFDSDTYATSKSGYKIENQFDDTDLNIYENGAQSITYVSRADWENTFPEKNVELKITEQMAADLVDSVYLSAGRTEESTEEMPVMGAENNLSVVEMRGKAFDDPDWELLLDQMSYEEMADMVGNAFHLTKPVDSVNLPDTRDENGPQGLTARLMKGKVDSTSFTSEDIMAATWNVDLIAEVGEVIGEDCLANGYDGLYGPGNNIHRTPYSGRNFEYYSEDGFLSGVMSEAEVSAIHSNGIYVFMKHAALNDGETQRNGLSTWANEQSIRQIYLKSFQYAMENNETAGVMTAMPRIGCTWAGADRGLIRGVFRGEWNNKGMYISDNTTLHSFMSGIDAVLAGSTLFDAMARKQYNQYMEKGQGDAVVANALREACHYNLYVLSNSAVMNGLTEDSTVEHVLPGWMIAIRVITAAVIGLFVWQVSMAIIRGRKYRKNLRQRNADVKE